MTAPRQTLETPEPLAGQYPAVRWIRLFQPRFAALVESGLKLQTVRPVPKRMPKPGDTISLRAWTGAPYRSKQRVLREATIVGVDEVRIDRATIAVGGTLRLLETFASQDGFASFAEMRDWFQATHGLPFTGILITWEQP